MNINIREKDLPNIKKIGIYCITNLVNDKKYIGKVGHITGFIKRWDNHLRQLKNGIKNNSHFQDSFNKYGIDNFEFSILEIVEPLEDKTILNNILNFWERYYISYYDTYNSNKGYNLTKGGEGSLGYTVSKEQKEKQSLTRKEKFKNGEYNWKHNTNSWNRGLTKNNCLYLFEQSIKYSGKNNPSSVAIVQLNLNFILKKPYQFVKQVENEGFSYTKVSECINKNYISGGINHNIYGKKGKEKYIWMKLDEYLDYLNKNNLELSKILIDFLEENKDIEQKYIIKKEVE